MADKHEIEKTISDLTTDREVELSPWLSIWEALYIYMDLSETNKQTRRNTDSAPKYHAIEAVNLRETESDQLSEWMQDLSY